MTNPVLDNNLENTNVILWQYDQAWNLIRLIESWNTWAKYSSQYFWDRFWGNNETFLKGTFFIDQADKFGLTVWGLMLGIPRPQIRIPKAYVDDDDSSSIGSDSSDSDEFVDTFISDDLYRRLLKARFFLMNHKPTVPNYNKYLVILFGGIRDGEIITNTREIFNCYGSPNVDDNGDEVSNPVYSRCKVLDFQDMSMGFTFPLPKDNDVEEAYLIFQHYDLVYPFPAGIRYRGESIYDKLVIGLNTNQKTQTEEPNQNYKNFVDGLVLADDEGDVGNPNGGIFSTTDRANYKINPNVKGIACLYNCVVDDSDSSSDSSDDGWYLSLTFDNISETMQTVWLDFGNGDCGYRHIPSGVSRTFETNYKESGIYAVMILFDSSSVNITDEMDEKFFKKYDLVGSSI